MYEFTHIHSCQEIFEMYMCSDSTFYNIDSILKCKYLKNKWCKIFIIIVLKTFRYKKYTIKNIDFN